ncbi:MAG: hypothetical protein DRJ42_01215 [Deltaproteobacteria bacterium]|nr:MAG: hypothetical protein DRJ42_01215 [Deltaproteobacteria bacterium]
MSSSAEMPGRREISDFDALVDLFADLPSELVQCRFEGVDFDVSQDGKALLLAATLAGGIAVGALVDRLQRARPRGTYARLFFARSAAIDLVVSPRRDRLGEDFAGCYQVDALVPKMAATFLGEALPPLLAELWPRYHVSVRDEFLDVGVFSGAPLESARAISDLIDAMHEAPEEQAALSPEEAAALDSFCFYCGNGVASSATTCPHCDGDLSED